MVVWIVPFLQVVLVAIVVGLFIDHEAARLHPDGAAALEGAHQVHTVAMAHVTAPGEVPVLIKDDLWNS